MNDIKAEILACIKLFITNLSDDILNELINDAVVDVCDFINYAEGDAFPDACKVIVKDLVKIRVNKMGAEGLTIQSYSGRSEHYANDLPADIKRKLMRHRKLPG